MAFSDNLVTMEPWPFRPIFADSWLNEAFARDAETLTKELQKSLSSHSDNNVSSDIINPFYHLETTPVHTPTVSGGSENETAVSKRRNIGKGVGGVNGGKITKRRSRASKRTTTMFITADPANFRQMVQQVTGVRFEGNGQLQVTPVLKPEPQLPVNRLQTGCLPTLDTSAFLLDPTNQQQHQVGPASGLVVQPQVAFSIAQPPPAVVADGGSAGFDFESFCSFPTLESWEAMQFWQSNVI